MFIVRWVIKSKLNIIQSNRSNGFIRCWVIKIKLSVLQSKLGKLNVTWAIWSKVNLIENQFSKDISKLSNQGLTYYDSG